MENVITLGKLIGLLFCPPPPPSYLFSFSKISNELDRPVMGTIFTPHMHREWSNVIGLVSISESAVALSM